MTGLSRPYRDETDFARLRSLLSEGLLLEGRPRNWTPARLEVDRFAVHTREELAGYRRWLADARLWETGGDRLAGAVYPEGSDTACLQSHPAYRSLEDEMLEWAEGHRLASLPAGARSWSLFTYAYDFDEERKQLLARRGYLPIGPAYCMRRHPLGRHPPGRHPLDVTVPDPAPRLLPGYEIRALERSSETDLEQLATVTNAVFARGNWTSGTIRAVGASPLYLADLDLVAVAPDGAFAAFALAWFDPATRTVEFEPVGTHRAHRRRGLGAALMQEGMRRAQALGAALAYVSAAAGSASNSLYEAAGFTEYDVEWRWQKQLV